MRAIDFIQEARRNPEQNPKVSVNDEIINALARAEPIDNTGHKNLFVSFTGLEKLGINPRSEYNTPLGIYAYPADYIIKTVGSKFGMEDLPFAGDQPWANIFRVEKGTVLNISAMSKSSLQNYLEKLKDLYVKTGIIANDDFEYVERNAPVFAMIDSNGGHFWYITLEIAKLLVFKKTGRDRDDTGVSSQWTEVFRNLGITGVVDYDDGIIHENEPTQAVFFEKPNLTVIKRVANKYSETNVDTAVRLGARLKQNFETQIKLLREYLKTRPTAIDLRKFLITNQLQDVFRYVPTEYRLAIIKSDLDMIRFLGRTITPQDFMTALAVNPVKLLELTRAGTNIANLAGTKGNPLWIKLVSQEQLASALFAYLPKLGNRKLTTGYTDKLFDSITDISGPSSFKMSTPLARALIMFSPRLITKITRMNQDPANIELARSLALERGDPDLIDYINQNYVKST